MKRLLAVAVAFFLVVICLVSSVLAGEKEATFSYEVAVSGLTKYVGEVNGIEYYDKFVFQPSFTISHNPTGLYANLWGSYSPKDGFNSDAGDEIDYIVGINRNLGAVNVDLYYAYYNVVKLGEHGSGDVHAIGAKMTLPEIWKVTPYLAAEYDFIRKAEDVEESQDGLSYRAGFCFSPVEKLKMDLSISGHGRFLGVRAETVSSALLKVAYEFSATESIKITPEINFQKRLGRSEENNGLTRDLIWGGITLSFSF